MFSLSELDKQNNKATKWLGKNKKKRMMFVQKAREKKGKGFYNANKNQVIKCKL